MPTSPEEKGFGQADPALARWAERVFAPEDAVLQEIRERSVREGLPAIAVGKFDGLHLEVLTRAAGARKAVEIGTLGGYSGVCILRGLGPQGFLHTFEFEPHHARVAQESFEKAGVAAQARIYLGAASARLHEIESEGPFDLCFIDADKTGYPAYLDWAGEHLRVGGLLLGDNAFGWGGVAKEGGEPGIEAIKRFNRELAVGGRFRATMIPTAEGLAMGVKVR